MKNFLLEILCEEIPADLQEYGLSHLYEKFGHYCSGKGVTIQSQECFYSPRRLTLCLDLSFEKINKSEIVRGPKVGIPEEILNKFLEKNNSKKEDLVEIDYNKFKYYAIQIEENLNSSEQEIKKNLANICLETLNQISWPRKMKWHKDGKEWVRPIRNILALYKNEIIDFEFTNVKSTNYTFGHKMLADNIEIEINNIADYKEKLKINKVIVDQNERKDIITDFCANHGIQCDFKLLKTLTNIAEFPNILECQIPDEFMSLPQQVIAYTMIHHQKYIPLSANDRLVQKFLVVIDHNNPNEIMRQGYERVLNARLSDAKFFWNRFCNSKIEDLIENLKLHQSEYIPDMNIFEFNNHINKQLKEKGCDNIDLNVLSCDLGSEIYSEYPALRGLLAYEYLMKNHYPKEICTIAREIYYGESELYERNYEPEDEIIKIIIALKYHAMLKHYLIDKKEKPTTSRDPFALKRTIKIIYDLHPELLNEFRDSDFVLNVIKNYQTNS